MTRVRRVDDDQEDYNGVSTAHDPALLVIAHGTRDPAGPREMAQLV